MGGEETALTVEAVGLQRRAKSLTAGRTVLGLLAFVAPDAVFRIFGFGKGRRTAFERYGLRLYAVREFALGVHLWWEASHGTPTVSTAVLNTAVDGVDAVMSLAAAVTRPEIRRGSWTIVAFAGFVTGQWVQYTRRVMAHHAAVAAAGPRSA